MLTTHTKDLLDHVRAGRFEPLDIPEIERLSRQSLVQELAAPYPVLFQQRSLKNKWEIGLARKVRYELNFRGRSGSSFPTVVLSTVLRDCVLASGYDDAVSEISLVSRIRIWLIRNPVNGLAVKIGHGYKLDRMPDEWQLKPVSPAIAKLAEGVLRSRGWQFDVLSPLKSTS